MRDTDTIRHDPPRRKPCVADRFHVKQDMDVDEAVAVLLREADRGGQNELARALGVAPSTLSKWRKGEVPQGKNRARVIAYAEQLAQQRPALPPVQAPGDYWRGVYYACERMSLTVGELLKEAREADEVGRLRAEALAAIPPVGAPSAGPVASETPPRRQRRG